MNHNISHAPNPIYVNDPQGGAVVDITQLTVDTALSAGVWTTIGPTGSGATVIWTALDAVPLGVKWLELMCFNSVTSTSGTSPRNAFTQVHTRLVGSSRSIETANYLSYVSAYLAGYTGSQSIAFGNVCHGKTPVDGSNIFECRWNRSGASGQTIVFGLKGYGYN